MATNLRPGAPSASDRQLSLFPDATGDELIDNSLEESINERRDYTHTAWAPDSGTLEAPPADDGRDAEQGESAPTGGLRSAGVDGEPAIRADGGSEDGLPAGLGDRDEGMGVSPGRERPTPVVVRSGNS